VIIAVSGCAGFEQLSQTISANGIRSSIQSLKPQAAALVVACPLMPFVPDATTPTVSKT